MGGGVSCSSTLRVGRTHDAWPHVPAPRGRADLVSCIMPTQNRRAFIMGALAGFWAQDYLRLELVVVDDGTDPVADLMPDDTRVRYFGFPRAYRLA